MAEKLAEAGISLSPHTTLDMIPVTSNRVTDETLLRMNKIGFFLHFSQATLMLCTFLFVDSVNSFSRPVYNSYLAFDPITNNFAQNSTLVFEAKIGLITPFFLYLSAVAHFLIVFIYPDAYLTGLTNNINRTRWYEYAISSSLMIVMIAILFGVWDFGNLIAITGCNISMNLFGLLMEEQNDLNNHIKPIDWTAFNVGCFAGVVPWVNILLAFLGAGDYSNIPGFVYGILIGYFVFFNTFPVNMMLQYKRWGKWADYRYGEIVYIWLSLLSKSLLAWLVFGGTFQPNGD